MQFRSKRNIRDLVLLLILWASLSLNLYLFVFQVPTAISRLRLALSGVIGGILILYLFMVSPSLTLVYTKSKRGWVSFFSLIGTIFIYLTFPMPSLRLFALKETVRAQFIPIDSPVSPQIEVTGIQNGLDDISFKKMQWVGNVEIEKNVVRFNAPQGEELGFIWQGRGWEKFTLYLRGRGQWLVRLQGRHHNTEVTITGNPTFEATVILPIGTSFEMSSVYVLIWINVFISFILLFYFLWPAETKSNLTLNPFLTRLGLKSLIFISIGAVILCWLFIILIASYNRLYADDYCYLSALREYGWWKAIWNFYRGTNGRIMSHVFNFTAYLLGKSSVPLGPLVIALCFGGGLYALLRSFFPTTHRGLLVGISSTITFFCFMVPPDQYRAVFWTLHAGIMGGGFLFLFLATTMWWKIQEQSPKLKNLVILFFLALLSACFNEAISIIGGALFSGLTLMEWLFCRQDGNSPRIPIALYGLLGITLGFVIVVFSPGNHYRMDALGVATSYQDVIINWNNLVTNNLPLIFFGSDAQKIPPLSYMLGASFLGITGGLMLNVHPFPIQPQLQWWKKTLIVLSPLAIILIMFVPSSFVNGYFPHRTLFAPQSMLVLWFFLTAVWLGSTLKRNKFPLGRGAVVLALVCVLALSWVSWQHLSPMYQRMKLFSEEWDQREAYINQAIARGEKVVYVKPFKHIFGDDIQPNPKNWLTLCVGNYYGIPVYLDLTEQP